MSFLRRRAGVFALAALLHALAPTTAPAQEGTPGYVTGADWERSGRAAKQAYLLGIADLMSAEHAIQTRSGPAVRDQKSAIARLYRGFTGVSINEAVARIDAYYRNNPDQTGEPVLEALWISLVEQPR